MNNYIQNIQNVVFSLVHLVTLLLGAAYKLTWILAGLLLSVYTILCIISSLRSVRSFFLLTVYSEF